MQASGPLGSRAPPGDPHGFAGKPEDPSTDLYYFSARYYAPVVGRFITPDPAKQSLNQFSYAFSNPLRYTDPDGREAGALTLSWEIAVGSASLKGATLAIPGYWDDALVWGTIGAATGVGVTLAAVDNEAERAVAQAQAEVDEARRKEQYIQVVHFTDVSGAAGISAARGLKLGQSGMIYVSMPQFFIGMQPREIADKLGIPEAKAQFYVLFNVKAGEVSGPVIPARPAYGSRGGYPELHILHEISWRSPAEFAWRRPVILPVGPWFTPLLSFPW